MAINAKVSQSGGGALDFFEYNNDLDISLTGYPIFELDGDGNLQPTIDGTEDNFFEINEDNEITPQI